jgi:hypothetical protein
MYPPAPDRRAFDAEKAADNLAWCAHPHCQNPRRHAKGNDRLPFQERRAIQALGPAAQE